MVKPPLPITVVIPTLNEADRLAACLASVTWAAEVIVADGGSKDDTVRIAKEFGARVITNCGPTISAQRNAAIIAAAHRWILALDADERATPALCASIEQTLARPVADAYRVQLRNYYLGMPMDRGRWGRDWHVRLFRSHLRFEQKRVHEGLDYGGPEGLLDGYVDHDSYRSLSHHLHKVSTYSMWGAEDLFQRNRTAGFSHLVVRPLWRFVRAYLLDGNWRDGRRGLIFSVVHAWSAFAKYALLWDQERMALAARSQHGKAAASQPVVAAAPAAYSNVA